MDNRPVGVFDSGVGGISVLRELVKLMPEENYVYFGDSKNAPYGSKSANEVRKLSLDIAGYFKSINVKAIVVACNTATSAAVAEMRKLYEDIAVVGIEPAVKPAVRYKKGSRVLVLATPVTLREEKFRKLAASYETEAEIIPVPMEKLADMIEAGTGEKELESYIKEKLSDERYKNPDSVVLGCTHYAFVSEIISKILGDKVKIFDGGTGVAKETRRKLEENNALNSGEGSIVFKSSGDAEKLKQFAELYI